MKSNPSTVVRLRDLQRRLVRFSLAVRYRVDCISWGLRLAKWDWKRTSVGIDAIRNGWTDPESRRILKRRWVEANPEPTHPSKPNAVASARPQ